LDLSATEEQPEADKPRVLLYNASTARVSPTHIFLELPDSYRTDEEGINLAKQIADHLSTLSIGSSYAMHVFDKFFDAIAEEEEPKKQEVVDAFKEVLSAASNAAERTGALLDHEDIKRLSNALYEANDCSYLSIEAARDGFVAVLNAEAEHLDLHESSAATEEGLLPRCLAPILKCYQDLAGQSSPKISAAAARTAKVVDESSVPSGYATELMYRISDHLGSNTPLAVFERETNAVISTLGTTYSSAGNLPTLDHLTAVMSERQTADPDGLSGFIGDSLINADYPEFDPRAPLKKKPRRNWFMSGVRTVADTAILTYVFYSMGYIMNNEQSLPSSPLFSTPYPSLAAASALVSGMTGRYVIPSLAFLGSFAPEIYEASATFTTGVEPPDLLLSNVGMKTALGGFFYLVGCLLRSTFRREPRSHIF
jgi:hypothetical protein